MNVPINEQETTISFSRNEGSARVWTSDTTVMTRLDKLVASSPHYELLEAGVEKGGDSVLTKTYFIDDKSLVSFRGKKMRMNLTEGQKEERHRQMVEGLNAKRSEISRKDTE